MASALVQGRALAGGRAMSLVPTGSKPKAPSNGARVFMRRRDSYMVEVNVADTETEDQAVRRYMRAVVQSGVINKLRARRTKETKIETYKRKLAERAQARKLKIEEPTWEEAYRDNIEEAKPFDEFFCKPADDDDEPMYSSMMNGELPLLNDTYYDGPLFDLSAYDGGSWQAGYVQDQGGYLNAAEGGYVQQQDGSSVQQPEQQQQ